MSWYVAHTKPAHELVVVRALSGLRVRTFLPRIRSTVERGSTTIIREEPAFPMYVFVELDTLRWVHVVNNTQGVQCLVGGASPAPVRPHEMECLLDQFGERATMSIDRTTRKKTGSDPRFRVNDRARVTSGPLADFTGVVLMSQRERIRLLLSLFGRPTEVEFDRSQVEKLEGTA